MKYKEYYMELKKAMKLLANLHAFEQFNQYDLFYLLDNTSKGILICSDHILEGSKGVQIYFGDSGINYLYDSYMSQTGLILNPIYANMITIVFLSKSDLLEEDRRFLKEHNIRVSLENNLIPCEFQEGYDYKYLSIKKMKRVLAYLYYLISLIKNEREEIIQCFAEEKLVLAAFDPESHYYSLKYTSDAVLGTMPKLKKKNESFVVEYQDATYVEDVCYISRYFSFKKGTEGWYESILFGYYEKKEKHIMHRVICKPEQIGDYAIGVIDELFKQEGLPMKVVFNQRDMASSLYRTLEALHIETQFQRETESIDQLFFELFSKKIETIEEGEKRLDAALVS